jgi:hypothetical protein
VPAVDVTKPDAERFPPNAGGTGIYWFINPTGVRKIFVPRVTREAAADLARDLDRPGPQVLDSYRWVPDAVERADSLVMTICSGAQCRSDINCRDNACRCIANICQ